MEFIVNLSEKQRAVTAGLEPHVENSSWVLRVRDRTGMDGPYLEVIERVPGVGDRKRCMIHGTMYNGHLKSCRNALRKILQQVTDESGHPLGLHELIDAELAFRGYMPLDETAGIKIALLFILHLSRGGEKRMELMAWRIQRLSREEALYWFSKVTTEGTCGQTGKNWAKSGLRTVLCGSRDDKTGHVIDRLLAEYRS